MDKNYDTNLNLLMKDFNHEMSQDINKGPIVSRLHNLVINDLKAPSYLPKKDMPTLLQAHFFRMSH